MQADVSHFTMVGFPIAASDPAAMVRSVEPFLDHCAVEPLKNGSRLCTVRDPSGAELVIALDQDRDGAASLVTLNPAFRGESLVEVIVTGDASDPEWRTFERRIAGQLQGTETPIILDLADPRSAARARRGAKLTFSVAAFCFGPRIYPDIAAYYAAQKGGEVAFAADFFIPSGMFGTEAAKPAQLEARALFAGEVLKAERRRNTAGGTDFWWALLKGYEGMTIDVLLDPRQVEGSIVPGQHLDLSCWLSARPVP